MGLFKKVFRPVRKVLKKIIPKEIRPALPYIAASFGPAGLAGTKFASLNPAFQKALIAGATAAATDEDANILRTAALAAAPDALSQGLGNVAGRIDPNLIADSDSFVQIGDKAAKAAGALSRASEGIKGASALKTIGAQTAIDQSAKFAEIRQKELDEYNRNLREQGVLDKTKRRTAIYNIYINAGYEPEYVNSMLDRYGYAEGGITQLKRSLRNRRTVPNMTAAMKKFYGIEDEEEEKKVPKPKPPVIELEEGEEIEVDNKGGSVIRSKEEPDFVEAMLAAKSGVEQAFGIPFAGVEPAEFKRFARGGEVEIEEETEDLGIIDFMKDQGIPYGEMASHEGNERLLEQLYEEFLDMGLSPADAAKAAREAFDRMSSKPREGIMQMAKSDIEDMYEQYVFEMEEMGVTPMSFSEFVAREKAGMKDGGKVRRRKKGEPMDDDDKKPGPSLFPKVPKGNFFLDKMPKPKRREGILEVANGGEVLDPQSLPFPFFMEGGRPSSTKPGLDYYDQDQGSKGMMRKRKKKKREEKADGGIMEKDMRGGGFIPEGSKERADDVPARLSKNEFVMTADAVRAAGGGSVNKGAKRMYDMMYRLEGKI